MGTREDMKQEYFEWLTHFIGCKSYRKLLFFLFSVDFQYTNPMDGNRYEDGINLRYRFADERGYHYRYVSAWLDNVPCSMLEMMVALALRIEEEIAGDPEYGDQTDKWFKVMLNSSGLSEYDDESYDEHACVGIVKGILSHSYQRNGEGGLFRLRHSRRDLRSVEIWYQAMWYINEALHIT